jgi:hypothetical protein
LEKLVKGAIMKNILAIFKKIKIRKKNKKEEPEETAKQEEAAKEELAADDTEEAEGKPSKKRKFPAPPKVAGSKGLFKGKRKILAIVLVIVLAAGAGGGFAMMKLGMIGASSKEKKTESSESENSNSAEGGHASEGEHGAQESKAAESQIAKITITAIDIDLGELEGHLASNYIKILRTQNYTIRYRTTTVYDGQPYEVETTYAVYGGNVAMASADRSTVILNQNVYMMNHTNKTMISWRATQTENLRTIDTSDITFVGSSEAGGLICEEYTTATARIKFYFKDEALVKIITVINNQDADMDILEFKEGVPMDLFTVPGDYQNTNITDTVDAGQRP